MAGNPVVQACGPSYQLADRKSAVQRAVNLFMREVEGIREARPITLASTDGLTLDVSLGAAVRGHYATETRRFAVAGSKLYEVSGGVATERGSLASSGGYVSMRHGRDQLVLVDGPFGYVLNLGTNVFAQITDTDYRGSNWVEELDGYFVFVDPDSDQFYLSAIDDATSLDALDFSSADAQPDDVVTHRVLKRELYLFGTLSTEVWIDSGTSDFPFVRYNSTPIDVGVVGTRAAINAADTLFFVGQTKRGRGIVYEMVGHQPVRRSHRAVEEALKASTDLSQCSMWAYQIEGAEFVGLNAPGMRTTWVYNAATKQWHECGTLSVGEWTPWGADEVVSIGGAHYASSGTALYLVDPAADVVCERTWPHLVSPSNEMVSYRSLELQCTRGQGGTVTLEASNDGGYVYGPPLARSTGVTGRRMQPVRWMPLGSAQDRVFRLRYVGAGPFAMHAATVDAG